MPKPPEVGTALQDFLDDEQQIRLALFKDLVRRPKHEVCFIQLAGNVDSDPSILKQFVKYSPSVKPASACEHRNDGIWNRVTGERGTLYTVGDITHISDTEVDVAAGYYYVSDGGATYTFRLKKVAGRWQVDDFEFGYVS